MDRLDVVEVMLTAEAYNDNPELNEDDLPPHFRKAAWNGERAIERPLVVTEEFVKEVHGDGEDGAWEAIEELPFTDRDSIDGTLRFTVSDLARDWYVDTDGRGACLARPMRSRTSSAKSSAWI
ncbi:MAG: hypothetical protein U5J64_05430 [Halobacteriales archaeon]|nr:hypothetical protein [Halobacteriales archaeon]